MSQISAVLRSVNGGLTFWCPGCNRAHTVQVTGGPGGNLPGLTWGWNLDVDRPVFTPSVLVRSNSIKHDEQGNWTGEWVLDAAGRAIEQVCHSFVGGSAGQVPGQIEFLGDCTHALAGKTVPMMTPAWWKWPP